MATRALAPLRSGLLVVLANQLFAPVPPLRANSCGLLVELASSKTLAKTPQPLQAHCSSSDSFQASPLLQLSFAAVSMPENFDDDEVGTGLYVLIGCAAVTVALMYSWIGYTLYQGFKARRKVD